MTPCFSLGNPMLGYKAMNAGLPAFLVQAMCMDAATGLTASGTNQSTALELVNADNDVTTVASGTGVKLFASSTAGDTQTVFNSGANPLSIYPGSGSKINNLPTNQAVLLPINTGCLFKRVSSTKWFAVLSA